MKISNHNVSLRSGGVHDAIIEEAEKATEKIALHHGNPDVRDKASTYTIKVTMTPTGTEGEFMTEVQGTESLAARKPASRMQFARIRDGIVTVVENDPRQLSIDLEKERF